MEVILTVPKVAHRGSERQQPLWYICLRIFVCGASLQGWPGSELVFEVRENQVPPWPWANHVTFCLVPSLWVLNSKPAPRVELRRAPHRVIQRSVVQKSSLIYDLFLQLFFWHVVFQLFLKWLQWLEMYCSVRVTFIVFHFVILSELHFQPLRKSLITFLQVILHVLNMAIRSL